MKMVHVVLVHPQIPPNTGNIARLCAGLKCPLHLVKPLGFSTDDRYLKRAGLDYWPHVDLHYHESLEDFLEEHKNKRMYFFSTKSKNSYIRASFQKDDMLIFGSETKGLPINILEANWDATLTIPMKGPIRSYNLSSSVAMALGEALRQTGDLP